MEDLVTLVMLDDNVDVLLPPTVLDELDPGFGLELARAFMISAAF